MKVAYLLLVLALLFCVAAVDCPPSSTPPAPATSTPAPPPTDEPTPSSPPPETTATPYPQSEPTPTLGVTPDPSPTTTPGTGTPDGERHPTPQTTLPVTGGGMPPNVQIGLTVIVGIILLFVAAMARRARNAH